MQPKLFLKNQRKNPRFLTVSVFIFVLIISGLIINRAEERLFLDAESILRQKINSGISEILSTEEYNPESFIVIEKNSSGEVSAIISDMRALNKLSDRILSMVKNSGFETEVRLGAVLGLKAFKNSGPAVPVKITISENSGAESENNVLKLSKGSRFTLTVRLRVCANIILPLKRKETEIQTDITIAEALLLSENAA